MPDRYARLVIGDVAGGMPQQIVAISYATAILAAAKGFEDVDWTAVNRVIIDRWSLSGLDRIKHKAWKLANDTHG